MNIPNSLRQVYDMLSKFAMRQTAMNHKIPLKRRPLTKKAGPEVRLFRFRKTYRLFSGVFAAVPGFFVGIVLRFRAMGRFRILAQIIAALLHAFALFLFVRGGTILTSLFGLIGLLVRLMILF